MASKSHVLIVAAGTGMTTNVYRELPMTSMTQGRIILSMLLILTAALLFAIEANAEDSRLLQFINGRETAAKERVETAREELAQFERLSSLAAAAMRDPASSAKPFLSAIFDAVKAGRIDASGMRDVYDFFMAHDPGFKSHVQGNTMKLSLDAPAGNASQGTQYADQLQVRARRLGMSLSSSTDKARFELRLGLAVTDQGAVMKSAIKSFRVSGLLRVLGGDGTPRASWNLSEAAAHLSPAEAVAKAVEKLGEKAAFKLAVFQLEDYLGAVRYRECGCANRTHRTCAARERAHPRAGGRDAEPAA